MKTFKEFIAESEQIDEIRAEKSYATDGVADKLRSISKKSKKQNESSFLQMLADRITQKYPTSITRVELHNMALADSELDKLRKEVDMINVLGNVLKATK